MQSRFEAQMHPGVAEIIRTYTRKHQVSATELFRRMTSIYVFFYEEHQQGRILAATEKSSYKSVPIETYYGPHVAWSDREADVWLRVNMNTASKEAVSRFYDELGYSPTELLHQMCGLFCFVELSKMLGKQLVTMEVDGTNRREIHTFH